ncbi:MAG: hypothetical protein MZW92_65785 [Comamonadaceae bacterium]|nr:hypothetical protein [Comamonadaceae bacterium]
MRRMRSRQRPGLLLAALEAERGTRRLQTQEKPMKPDPVRSRSRRRGASAPARSPPDARSASRPGGRADRDDAGQPAARLRPRPRRRGHRARADR